jgi:hypothetical protein
MYNIAVTIAVMIAAFCIMYAISESRDLIEEYQEWHTERRRAEYRAKAYKAMRERQVKQSNRENLWRAMK